MLAGERPAAAPTWSARLMDAYTFLRNLEHRLQYIDDAQTHTLPPNQADRLAVAQMMGLLDVATHAGAQLDAHRAVRGRSSLTPSSPIRPATAVKMSTAATSYECADA